MKMNRRNFVQAAGAATAAGMLGAPYLAVGGSHGGLNEITTIHFHLSDSPSGHLALA